MDSCYSCDHTAGDQAQQHASCNRNTALEWSVIDYWGVGGLKHVLLGPILALRFCSSSKKVSLLINESSQETNKTQKRPMMNQRLELDRNNIL